MGSTTKIPWTQATWNPVVGCTKVSPGCANCYAARMAWRLGEMCKADIVKGRNPGRKANYLKVIGSNRKWNGDVYCDHAALGDPLRWRKGRHVLVPSMGDLFHEGVPLPFIHKVLAVTQLARQHTFQVLTKRPERMVDCVSARDCPFRVGDAAAHLVPPQDQCCIADQWGDVRPVSNALIADGGLKDEFRKLWPPSNIWSGVSVENQDQMWRAAELCKSPAALRFISAEPLLGEIAFNPVPFDDLVRAGCLRQSVRGWLDFIDWVIVGGESGPGARPMRLEWVRSIIAQCRAAGVPVFVKQICDDKGRPIPFEQWPKRLQIREWPKGVAA